MLVVRGGPQTAAVRFDDPAADAQSQAHAIGLGGEKGVEQPICMPRIEPNTAVLHRDQNLA